MQGIEHDTTQIPPCDCDVSYQCSSCHHCLNCNYEPSCDSCHKCDTCASNYEDGCCGESR